jgi:hypothetical protein
MARTITTPYLHRIVFLVLFLLVWLGGNLQWCIWGVTGGMGRDERGKNERDGRWGKMGSRRREMRRGERDGRGKGDERGRREGEAVII